MAKPNLRKEYQGKDARAWYNLGEEARSNGDLGLALDAYRVSLKLNPRAAAAWIGLAEVLQANQQFTDALECLKRAAQAEPSNGAVLSRLARAHMGLSEVAAAKQVFERALDVAPNYVAAHVGMGELLEDLGEPEAAARSYREALHIDPSHALALANLLGLGRHVDIEQEKAQANVLMTNGDDVDSALIGYGLGKARDQDKDYDGAFAAYNAANAARRRAAGAFDEEFLNARIDALISVFTPDYVAERQSWGHPSDRPVFIVGLPRSGTTLTEQILSAHPACFGAGELNTLTDLTTGTPDRLNDPDVSWPTSAEHLSQNQAIDIGQDYLRQAHVSAPPGMRRVIDKQPLNFWHLGMLILALPNARIIHCTRDIRDTGLSIYAHNFNSSQRWATSLDDIGTYWRGYQRLMAHWKSLGVLNILDIAYEDTVSDIENQAQKLLAWADLEWDEKVLAFHQSERAVQTPSRWQVRQPLYSGSKGKWRRYQKHLGPLIALTEND